MPNNIHGLHDDKGSNDDSEDETEKRFVGGVDARGGGSGLAVLPSNDDKKSSASDSIFNRANADTAASGGSGGGGGGGEVRRTITMYRSGFTVDDGPYRQLNDPNNSEFLTALARGMIPRELSEEAGGDGEVAVGLVDKRGEEYDPEKHGSSGGGGGGGGSGFQSFSGEGQSLAASARPMVMAGVIDPSNAGTPQPLDESRPTTSIAIRLLNGKRIVVKVNLDSPVLELGQHISDQAGSDSYVLTSGYPPATTDDLGKTIEEAGLKGAQVVLKKA